MSIWDKIPAKWFLAIATFLGLAITLYEAFIKVDAPELEYTILSEISVFNRQDEVSSLKILLDTLDVQQNKGNITFYTIKVINNGTMHISHGMYDASDFGLGIKNGFLIKSPILVEYSNEHIAKRFQEIEVNQSNTFIQFPYIPLDVNDNYIVKLGIYHNDSIKPSFVCEGKITGQKDIRITSALERQSIPFLRNLLAGKWYIHAIRLVVYGILFVAMFFVIAYIPIVYIPDIKKKQQRTAFLIAAGCDSLPQKVRYDYMNYGERYINQIYWTLNLDSEKLNNNYHASRKYTKNSFNANNKEQMQFHTDRIQLYDKLIASGYLIAKEDSIISIDNELKDAIVILRKNLVYHGQIKKQ